jgi:NOL1/NOP2/fmu family ribosome biogenesis protein
MAVLRKKGTQEMSKPLKQKKHKLSITGELDWLVPSKEFVGIETENQIYAIPKHWSDVYLQIKDFLHIIHAGICYGKRKGKDIIPEQSLALSTFLNRRAFVEIELPYQQAINYLRTEAISLPADTPKGIILVTFHDIPLGFVKNIGNRANNLYPKEWKIKSTYIPDYETIFSFA